MDLIRIDYTTEQERDQAIADLESQGHKVEVIERSGWKYVITRQPTLADRLKDLEKRTAALERRSQIEI